LEPRRNVVALSDQTLAIRRKQPLSARWTTPPRMQRPRTGQKRHGPSIGQPPPAQPLSEIGVELWQHDLWLKIIEAAQGNHPNWVELMHHPAISSPAVSLYGATNPALLGWFNVIHVAVRTRQNCKPAAAGKAHKTLH
jgi:hypothetical protein